MSPYLMPLRQPNRLDGHGRSIGTAAHQVSNLVTLKGYIPRLDKYSKWHAPFHSITQEVRLNPMVVESFDDCKWHVALSDRDVTGCNIWSPRMIIKKIILKEVNILARERIG
ncbi:hypothetical protein AVEN_18833-1 [Araneus ventricosus]|uniref:Uncharacterized protein n=1 Tax=Araneus ventricosus TaxID=182803 RepID=A0A4Y2JEI6_ARAVE|nr:hypothetical protein AVEN_18833-1 [Araneus ventricosus]